MNSWKQIGIGLMFLAFGGAFARAELVEGTGNLAEFLQAIPIPGPNTEAFVAPSQADRLAWRGVIGHVWRGDLVVAAAQAELQGYDVHRFHDTVTGLPYLVLRERLVNGVPRRGLGTYVYSPTWSRPLNIQAPHAFATDDRNTRDESIAMFLELRAAFLQIAGTSRTANSQASPCGIGTGIADVANSVDNFFQEASVAVAELSPLLVSISVHGFGAGGSSCPPALVDPAATSLAVIGNGICGDDDCPGRGEVENSLATRLAAAINQRLAGTSYPGRGAGSENATANDPADLHVVGCPTPSGNNNMQGRAINGAVNPCSDVVWTIPPKERFIHLEQQFDLRRSPNDSSNPHPGVNWQIVISALAEIFRELAIDVPLTAVAVVVSGGNNDGRIDPNECNRLTISVRNNSTTVMTGVEGLLTTRTPGVCISQSYSPYQNIPAGGTRPNLYPFEISTLPGFVCGTDIELVLVVTTAAQGKFSVPITLPTGIPGTAQSFHAGGGSPLVIPDNGVIESFLPVSGVNGLVGRITVSLQITHGFTGDLDVDLISPGGIIVNLTSDHGGAGDNYGVDCTQRTTFDDRAATAISAGIAPFFGSFRPEVPLAAFHGLSGAAVNGIWRLRLRDDLVGNQGALRCWSLHISPLICTNGPGPCLLCSGVYTNSITTNDLTQVPRLTRQGFDQASDCTFQKECPPLIGTGPYHYDAYTFLNRNQSDACVTVNLATACTNANEQLFCVAYLNTFNPADIRANYLADLGDSPKASNPAPSFSFIVPAQAGLVIVVHEVNAGAGCDAYTLTVCGLDCQPRIRLVPVPIPGPPGFGPFRFRLDWPVIPPGYTLQSSTDASGTNWQSVPGLLSTNGDQFSLMQTNTGRQRYYRLAK